MLDKTHFINYLNSPQGLSLNDIMLLENTTKRYPYFQLGYTLIAKGIHLKAPEISHDAVRKAAIYALSRNALRKVIENEIDWTANYSHKIYENTAESKFSQDPIEDELKREKLEEELIEAIARPALRNIQDEQLAIIDEFIKKEPRIQPIRTNGNDDVEDLSERSTKLNSPLQTESYAKILVKQGRFSVAIEVYQKLMLKNPEKSIYFAEKIAELNKKIIS